MKKAIARFVIDPRTFVRASQESSSHGHVLVPFGWVKPDVASDKRRGQEVMSLFVFIAVTAEFLRTQINTQLHRPISRSQKLSAQPY